MIWRRSITNFRQSCRPQVAAKLGRLYQVHTIGILDRSPSCRAARVGIVSISLFAFATTAASAVTLEEALVTSYTHNAALNAQRARVRAVDENVPKALSGYRPSIYATLGASVDHQTTVQKFGKDNFRISNDVMPKSAEVVAKQTLFDGFQTANRARAAESDVYAAREILRLMEQQVLLDTAAAYMDLSRDIAILTLQTRNLALLQTQLQQTRDKFRASDITITDVAQAESRVGLAKSQLAAAEANLASSKAEYRRVVGQDADRLVPATPVDRFAPQSLLSTVEWAQRSHPSVTAALYGVDVARLQIRIAEGGLYPFADVTAFVRKDFEPAQRIESIVSHSVIGQITIPLYQGGAEWANIRQAKELASEKGFDLTRVREAVRAFAVQAWSQLHAAKIQITATQEQVSGAETALRGVTEEARVGQRTTLDVLNAQQELLNARVALVTVQRNRVVGSYRLLAAAGGLSAGILELPVAIYDPSVSYREVRDSWIGLRSPTP